MEGTHQAGRTERRGRRRGRRGRRKGRGGREKRRGKEKRRRELREHDCNMSKMKNLRAYHI